jgi:endonuclease IV
LRQRHTNPPSNTCHIWEDETEKEKKEAKKWIDKMNAKLEAECKAAWELETAMKRLNMRRNLPRRKSKWRFTETTGKLERKASRGGID